MGRVTVLEDQIRQLSEVELTEFRLWFAEFDAQAWDRQIESDALAGRLDRLADEAIQAHTAGETTEL